MNSVPEELRLMREREIARIKQIESETLERNNTVRVFLAGTIGYFAGSSSRNLAYFLGFLSLGCFNERFQCMSRNYSCESIEIRSYDVGNEFSNKAYVEFIEVNGKKYLPKISKSGDITGLLEAREVIIDINTGEVTIGGLEISIVNTENTIKINPRTSKYK